MDEFCRLLLDAADVGSEYWTKSKNAKDPEKQLLMELLEAKIDGFQRKIELFRLLIQPNLKIHDTDSMLDLLADFFDALTGGNFGSKARAANPTRAKLVYATAADVVAHVRKISPRPDLTVLVGVILAGFIAALTVFH